MQYNFIYIIIIVITIFNIINENILRITLIIISISMISLFIYKNKSDIINKIDTIGFEDKPKPDTPKPDKPKINKPYKLSKEEIKKKLSEVESGLKEFEKYSKSNEFFTKAATGEDFILSKDSSSFENAKNYYKKLNNNMKKLESGEVKYTEYTIDSLMELLNKTCNAYQSISITIPPNNINNAYKTADFSVDKKNKKLHKLVSDLHGLKSKEIYEIYDIYNKKNNINQYFKFMYSGPEPYIKNEYNLY